MKNSTTSDEITCDITSNCAEIVDAEINEIIHDFVKMYSSATEIKLLISNYVRFMYCVMEIHMELSICNLCAY